MPILQWLNKDKSIHQTEEVSYRLLKETPEHSYGDSNTENMLIQGDNLDALKALLPYYAGKVKCIFIDPPYNTKSAFEYYEDNLEHTKWLEMMYPRLELLRELLTENGSIWVTIDDNEAHYLKVIMDEIFGRKNFLNEISAKMKQTSGASGGGEDKRLKKNIEYILVYSKNIDRLSKFNVVYEKQDLFSYIDDMNADGKSWKYTRIVKNYGAKKFLKEIKDGAGESILIFEHKNVELSPIKKLAEEDNITVKECYIKYFNDIFRDTNAQSSIRTRVMEATQRSSSNFFSIEYVPKSGKNKGVKTTLYYKGNNCDLLAWLSDICIKEGNRIVRQEKLGTYWEGFPLNNLTKEGDVRFANGKKPEELIRRIIYLSTQPGDYVLDSFSGSGTTAAVAHKIRRNYIGIEMGDHAKTHCAERLKKVVDGEQGGISKEVDWQGGGGYRFYTLGEAIFDEDGQINPRIRFQHLAAHIWFSETHTPYNMKRKSPLLGVYKDVAYYLLYNGVLGDKRPNGGNVLTSKVLKGLPQHSGPKVIYGETTRLGSATLEKYNITFKQTPYDIKAR